MLFFHYVLHQEAFLGSIISSICGFTISSCIGCLGLRRIENGYFRGNEKSRRMQLKLGYKDEGIRRKRFLCLATNEYVDECITGLLKEEFIEWSDKIEW